MLPTLEEAREEIKSNKELRNIVPKDNTDNNLLIKLVFWYKLSRNDICINLREWFDRNNLLVEDNSCGVQTKRNKKQIFMYLENHWIKSSFLLFFNYYCLDYHNAKLVISDCLLS